MARRAPETSNLGWVVDAVFFLPKLWMDMRNIICLFKHDYKNSYYATCYKLQRHVGSHLMESFCPNILPTGSPAYIHNIYYH